MSEKNKQHVKISFEMQRRIYIYRTCLCKHILVLEVSASKPKTFIELYIGRNKLPTYSNSNIILWGNRSSIRFSLKDLIRQGQKQTLR